MRVFLWSLWISGAAPFASARPDCPWGRQTPARVLPYTRAGRLNAAWRPRPARFCLAVLALSATSEMLGFGPLKHPWCRSRLRYRSPREPCTDRPLSCPPPTRSSAVWVSGLSPTTRTGTWRLPVSGWRRATAERRRSRALPKESRGQVRHSDSDPPAVRLSGRHDGRAAAAERIRRDVALRTHRPYRGAGQNGATGVAPRQFDGAGPSS